MAQTFANTPPDLRNAVAGVARFSETLNKQELAVDLRVDDIIRHTAISRNIPNLP